MKKNFKGGAMVVLLFLVTASLAFAGGQTETEESKAAAGPVKLTVALEAGFMADAGSSIVGAFESLHPNIKIEIVALPYSTFQQKTIQEFSAGSGAYDITEVTPSNIGVFVKNDWLLPLDELLKDAKLDLSDFVNPTVAIVTLRGKAEELNPKGKIWGLPYNSNVGMLMYRKDLYQQAGLDVPTSPDEELRAVRVLNDKDAGISGMILSGLDGPSSHAWQDFWNISLNTGGGMPLEEKGYRPRFINDGNKKALQLFHTYFSEDLVPKGALEYGYSEKNSALAQGLGAQMHQWVSAVKAIEDPSKSKVGGKIGYTAVPGGTGMAGGWAAVIVKTTKFPKESFTFLEFLTNHESTKKHAIEFGNGAVRKSVIRSAEFQKEYSFAPGLLDALNGGVDPRLTKPELTIWAKIQTIMNKEIMKAATGKVSVDEALTTINSVVEQDLKEAGFLK